MRPKQRIRKIYTESDIPERPSVLDQNLNKANNINIKDLELNLSDGSKSITDQRNNKNMMYKNAHFYMPNKFNKINRKQLIKKLPDINLTSLNTISKPLKLTPLDDKPEDRFSSTNKKNTFLLNSLFCKFQNNAEILKPDSNDRNDLARMKQRTLKLGQKKNISIDSFYQNQFINVTNSSTKNRGPKIIENEITRLSNHNNIMRRKIVSQEKSRPKYMDHSIDKLKQTTFEHFKRCVQRQEENEFGNPFNEQPKENFQNLQIITFYNKFPNVKKKQEEKPIKNIFSQEIKFQKQFKPSFGQVKSKVKTEQPEHEEENEFIFEKN